MIGLKRKPVNAVTNFVSTILQHFPPFRWEDEQEKAWMEAMIRELNGCNFSDAVLEKAITDMVRTRKDRRIPLVSECIAACNEAKRWLEAKDGTERLPIESPTSNLDWTEARLRLADDLVMGPEGRQAANEGWITQLHDYARKNQRLPPANEFGTLKRGAKEFEAAYETCVRGGWDQAAGLERIGADFLKKRERLAEMVLKGDRR